MDLASFSDAGYLLDFCSDLRIALAPGGFCMELGLMRGNCTVYEFLQLLVFYTHLRALDTVLYLVSRLLLAK